MKIFTKLKIPVLLVFVFIIIANFAIAQTTTIATTPTFVSNNGTGQVTFNFQNNNPYPVIIRGIESVSSTSVANTAILYYKTTPINGLPGAISAANGWNVAISQPFTGIANTSTTNTTTQPFITNANFIVPANTTWGFVLSSATVCVRYFTIPATMPGVITFSGGGCSILSGTNIGYSSTTLPPAAPAIASRGFVGKVIFEPAVKTYNDAAITSLISPINFCGGLQDIKVRVANAGANQLDSVRINWTLNNVAQPTIFFNTTLDTFLNAANNPIDTVITLTNYNFATSAPVALRAWTSFPNGIADTSTKNDTITVTLKPSLSGTYTVGATGADYPNLAAAAADLTSFGICGPVEIIVNPGTYNGKAVLNNVAGISSTNRILIRGTNKTTCILNDSLNDAILATVNSSYVTIRDLTVTNRFAGACAGISIVGNTTDTRGSNSSVINCNVNIPNAGSAISAGIFASGSNIAGSNNRLDSIVIDSNTVTGGYYGIVDYGNTAASAANNRGHLVRNNTINNAWAYGLYMYYIYNPCKVLNNYMSMNQSNTGTGYGMYFYYCQNSNATISTEIIGNRVVNPQYFGMYIYYNASTATAPTKIYNNSVSGNMIYSTNYGTYLYTGVAATYEYYHNTTHINGSANTQYGFYYYNTANISGINCKNNIFSLYSTNGTTLYPAYFSSNPVGNKINYNLYSNLKNTTLGYRGAAFTTSGYKTSTTGGDSSFNRIPQFISTSDLHLTDGCTQGFNLNSFVPADIDGTTRSITPNPGVYEYVGTSNDLTVDILYTPTMPVSPGAQNLVARVKNSGTNTVTSFDISYKHNNNAVVTIPWTGTLAACDTALITFTAANQITIVGGVNNISVYTSNPNAGVDNKLINDTLKASFSYYPPLSGNYTIGGTSASYSTFADATDALQNFGINGPVNFTINPGVYTSPVSLNSPVYGTSATNTITFDGVNSSNTSIVVSNAGPAFKINQVSYVTIKNLTVTNNIAGTGSGIALIGNTSNNSGIGFTVRNCVVNMPNTGTSTSYGIIVTGNSNGTADGNQWTDSVTIDSNTITGAYYGIQISSSANLNALYNRGHKIRYNVLSNTYYYGIRFYYIANPAEIIGNRISMNTSNASSYGIYFYYNQQTSSISSSKIIGNTVNAGYSPLYYYYFTTGSKPNEIYNNIFTCYGASGYSGMYVYTAATGGGTVNIYHNSVAMNGGSASYGLYYYNPNSTGTNNIKNNLFYAQGSGTYPAYFNTNPAGNVINYNNYFNASNGNLVYRGSAFNATNYLSATAGGDSSFNSQPSFYSTTNLRLNNACIKGVDLSAIVSSDIDNTSRPTNPVVGAHEAPSLANDLSLESVNIVGSILTTGTNLIVKVRNQSGNATTSFDLKYRVNNGTLITYNWTGTLAGCSSIDVPLNGINAINLTSGFNSIVMYTTNPNLTVDNNTLNDTLKFVLSTVSDAPGNALVGNGTNKYIKVNSHPSLNVGRNFTMEAWVYLPDALTRNQKVISKTKLPTTGNGYILGIVNGQIIPEIWDSIGTKTTHTTTATVPNNTWTHVACTWESGVALKTYINGNIVASTPISSLNPIGFSSSELSIGVASWDFGSFPVNGSVDEVRLWNVTLDSSAIRKNMHRMMPAGAAGLVNYWQFNEPVSATQIGDCVNGLVGNVIGASYINTSSVPAGGDTTYYEPTFSSGLISFKNITMNIVDAFDNNVDVVVNEVPYGPNVLPTSVANTLQNKYWIINTYGTPGVFNASLGFTLPSGQLNPSDTAVRLYNRSAYGMGAWNLVQTVGGSAVSSNTVTFNSISNLGQFTIASNGNSPLPVKLLTFAGEKVGDDIVLNWTTASEINNKGFVIERAYLGSDFNEIDFVASSKINSNSKLNYAYTDKNCDLTQTVFYRLKQVDLDGKYSYSPIVEIKSENNENSNVYPNPFTNKLSIQTEANSNSLIEVFDIQGRKVYTQMSNISGLTEIKSSEWESGIYFVKVNGMSAVKIIKQ
jgi:hypothetical protein